MKKQQLMPKLRFSEFEGDWEKSKLGDIGKVKMCKRIFNNETSENGDIPFYKIGTFGKKPDAFITKELYLKYKERFSFPKVGEILMSAAGTLGRTVIYDGADAYFQDSNIVWIENDEELVSNDFLYYIYQIVRYDSEGGTIQRLYNSIINNAKFIRPNLPEQQKIANFLTSIDTQIQTLEKKKSLLAQYKKGVLQKIFKQELRFKDKDGNDFPEWEEKKLGEYLTHKSRRNKKLVVTRTLSVSNSKGFILQSEQFDNHRVASKDVSNYKIVEKNDIAYNPSRINVGSIATLKDFEIGIVSPMYVVFSLKDTLDLSFFENLITTHLFKHLVKVGCSGSVRDSLNFDDLENFKLKVPSLKEQTKIANFLSVIDKNIALVNTKIEQTKGYKKGLLQQLFV